MNNRHTIAAILIQRDKQGILCTKIKKNIVDHNSFSGRIQHVSFGIKWLY